MHVCDVITIWRPLPFLQCMFPFYANFPFHAFNVYIIIIIIIIIITFITFMQGIYNYIPETNMFLWYTVLQLFCIYNFCYL